MRLEWLAAYDSFAREADNSPPSWDPTVCDLALAGTLSVRCPESILSGECVATRLVLIGDDAVDCILVGMRACSKLPDGKDPFDCCEFADEDPEVFRRSWLFWPVLN